MKRRLALAFTCLILAGCSDKPAATTSAIVHAPMRVSPEITLDPSEGKQFNLTVAEVKKVTVPETLTISGQIEPDTSLTTPVVSLMPGRIERAAAQLGDVVKKGQVLVEIRSDEVAQVESDLLRDVLSIDADIDETKVDLKLAQTVMQRKESLYKDGIAAKAEVDEAQRNLEHAEAKMTSLQTKRRAILTSAGERLRLFGVHNAELERLMNSRRIDNTFEMRSPRNGVISERDADIGQLIDNVHNLFVVSDLSRVWLMADVYERDIEKIRKDDHAIVTVDSFPNEKFVGEVDYIATNISPDTRTLKVRVTVNNPQLLLRPNMFARMVLETSKKSILAVPSEAIQKTGETYVAYVRIGDNRYMERKVEIGGTYGNLTEIKSGLTAGETVVAHGSLELQGEMIQRLTQ